MRARADAIRRILERRQRENALVSWGMRASSLGVRPLSPRSVAILVSIALPLVGCTQILGIDGDYAEAVKATGGKPGTGGASSTGGAESGGSSGAESGGGAGAETGGSGGASGAGGTETGGAGGVVAPPTGGTGGTGGVALVTDGGCAGCTTDCMPGTYKGTFKGKHSPAVTVVGVPFTMSGTFTFTLAGTGRVLNVTGSTGFESKLAWGVWTVGITGTFDCNTQTLTGDLTGELNAPPVVATLTGGITGKLSPSGGSGTWQEKEVGFGGDPAACATNPIAPNGTGCGTWTLTSRP